MHIKCPSPNFRHNSNSMIAVLSSSIGRVIALPLLVNRLGIPGGCKRLDISAHRMAFGVLCWQKNVKKR